MKRIILAFVFLHGCAGISLDRSLYLPAGTGIVAGFLGRSLSPNDESREINTVVFGALGVGLGFLAERLLTPKGKEEKPSSLKERELTGREFTLPATSEKLPAFVKKRLTPIVIEEYEERDSATEDGGLREPHKVWRIKRQPELIPIK
jgi:hypothetical protein